MRRAMRTFGFAFGLLAGSLLTACGHDSTGPGEPSGPPVIADLNGATQPSGPTGSTVIIQGQHYGSTQGPGTVLFSDGAGGTVSAVIASPDDWTNTFIVMTVPSGAASGNVVVRTSLGTSNAVVFTLTQNAVFSPSTITWSATNALPAGLSGHAVAFAEIRGSSTTRALYVSGGGNDSNAPSGAVYLATVGSSGTVSAWSATTALPTPVAFHATAVATPANSRLTNLGYLYVIGGAIDAGGQPTTNVYRGALSADGSVSGWVQTTPLPLALRSTGAIILNGDLYVAGGATTGHAPVGTVYRSRIAATGALGAWQVQAPLPFPRAHFGFGSFGRYLYALGGDSGAVAPNAGGKSGTAIADVVYARIDLRTGDLTPAGWTLNPSKLTKAVTKHTAVIAGGNVLITAGLYNGASSGSTEESYGQLSSDGSIGTFNGATGSNTISSLVGGGNLFNHAATGYTDGSGTFHLLVAGGDDVNSPGTKHDGVFFY
jgi:hypothetical protein